MSSSLETYVSFTIEKRSPLTLMPIPTFSGLAARVAGKLPLRTVLIVPFVLQIFGTVGLVSYLSYRNGQKAVVVPEAEFMTQIYANTRTTILLCIVALIGSIGIGILTACWITKHILRLNTAAQDQVAERTAELTNANEQLKLEIAERKLLEGKLYSSTQQVRTIFESITDIVLIINEKKNLQVIPTKAIGWDVGDSNWLNSIVEPFFQEDTAKIWFAKVQQVVETQQNIKFDYSLRIDNREVWLSACISPLPDNSVVWVARDISDVYDELRLRMQVELELRKQKELRETIYNESTDALFLVDAKTLLITDCNRRAVELFEVTCQEDLIGIEGRTLQRRPFTPEEIDQITTEMNQKGFWCMEIEYVTRTGKVFWGNIAAKPVQIAGQVVHLVRVTDINERKQFEQALRESEERFQEIARTISQCFFVRSASSGQFLYASPAYEKIWGRTCESLYQNPQSWLQALHPDDRELIRHSLREQFQGKSVSREYRIIQPDGSIHWIVAYISVVRDDAGQALRFIGIAEDISDRKRAELELQEREYRLRTLADNLPNGLIYQLIQEPNGKVYFSYITAGIERLVGIKPEVVMQDASVLDNLIIEEDRLLNDQLTEESRRNLSLFEMQMRKRTPTGEIQWSYVRSAPRRLDDGRTVWDGVEIDITNLKQAEAELAKAKEAAEAANRAKSAFLANMSHELRTPLNGILGYAQILQRDKNVTPKQKEGVDIIYQCGTHLLTLINDILDLSKIEAGKLELYPEDFNFPSFLTNITGIFRLKAEQKSLTFTYLALSTLPTAIHADEKRLRQVLMNLLSNAVKFTDIGSVTFKVEVIGNGSWVIGNEKQEQFPITNSQFPISKIRFQVEDTGIGLTPEQLEKIFLPFEQVGDSWRRAEGTGLGLAITQKILELMGGKVFVESTPKVGSRFWFYLDVPVVSIPMKSTPIKTTDTIIGYSGSKRKILIVDDRWENRAVFVNILEAIGFELEEAADGQEGLEKASEFQPDLILADLVMPIMDGYQMTRRLRELPELHNTIIIAISANAFVVDRQKSLESGCNDFLPKPVQSEDLLDKIKSYLNLSWIYDSESKSQSQKLGNESSRYSQVALTEMALPPTEELLALYDAANTGYVQGVEREAIRLQQLNPDYTPFATRILELAADFEYEEIANFIDRYLSESPE